MSYDTLVGVFREIFTNRVQVKFDYRHGLLGDGNGRVQVEGEQDFSFVRPDRFSKRAFKIFNKAVQGQDGDPVIIGELPWQPGLIQVIAFDWKTYSEIEGGWGNFAGGIPHGETHQWKDGSPGLDTFNVFRRQLGDLKLYPASGTSSMAVRVSAYEMEYQGGLYSWDDDQSFDTTPLIPGGGLARTSLAYWDPEAGSVNFVTGTAGTDLGGPKTNFAALVKPTQPAGTIPVGYVITTAGQINLGETDLRAAQPLFDFMPYWATGTILGWDDADIPITNPNGIFTGTATVAEALDQASNKATVLFSPDFSVRAAVTDNNGRVGIGAFAPLSSRLTIEDENGDSVPHMRIQGIGEDAQYGLNFDINASNQVSLDAYNDSSGIYIPLFIQGNDLIINSASGTGNVGIGGIPDEPLHIKVDNSSAIRVATFENINTGVNAQVRLQLFRGGDSGSGFNKGGVLFQTSSRFGFANYEAGEVTFYTGETAGSASARLTIEPDGDVGVGITSPLGKLHVDQPSTTGAKPVLYLDQADVSEEMIQFETTIGTGNAIEAVGAKILTTTHFIKVTLPGGLTRYIPCGTIA